MAPSAKDELLGVYLDQRPALVRAFAARTGSPERAQDIVQDIYVRLHALSQDAAEEIRHPVAFLYKIGTNLLVDDLRQRRRTALRDKAWSESDATVLDGVSVADLPSPEDAAWARLKLDRVTLALESLPPKARTAFRLHRIDGLTHAETAVRMGVSQSAVEKYLSAVLANLLKTVGWP